MRNRGLLGLKFRREVPFEGFVMDLYCASLRLCVEIDGDVHDSAAAIEYDAERTKTLELHGIRVVRLAARNVSYEALVRLIEPLL